jgi:hypothetical protein
MMVVISKSKRRDWPLAHCIGRSVGARPEAAQVPRRQHTGPQLLAGLSLEPVRLEMAGGIPRNLASKPAISRPDGESWDFDENEQDFGEKKNPPKPHANP